MIDKETWNVETDRDKMDKVIEYRCMCNIIKSVFCFKKTLSSNVKQLTPFFYKW